MKKSFVKLIYRRKKIQNKIRLKKRIRFDLILIWFFVMGGQNNPKFWCTLLKISTQSVNSLSHRDWVTQLQAFPLIGILHYYIWHIIQHFSMSTFFNCIYNLWIKHIWTAYLYCRFFTWPIITWILVSHSFLSLIKQGRWLRLYSFRST